MQIKSTLNACLLHSQKTALAATVLNLPAEHYTNIWFKTNVIGISFVYTEGNTNSICLKPDDTQLFLSFRPPDFHSSLNRLQDILQQISFWMTANLLTLNSFKTEFLLKQQLAKIHNSSLHCTHSARNLGFIFDEQLTFSDQISALSKSCYTHIRELHCIRPYLDSKTASLIATSILHSKLDYCNSLYSNLPKSQLHRLHPSIVDDLQVPASDQTVNFTDNRSRSDCSHSGVCQ